MSSSLAARNCSKSSASNCTDLPVISGVVQMTCEHWLLDTPLHYGRFCSILLCANVASARHSAANDLVQRTSDIPVQTTSETDTQK